MGVCTRDGYDKFAVTARDIVKFSQKL